MVLLNGALGYDERWVDLLYAIAIRLRGRRVGLLVTDATWHSRSTSSEGRIPALHRAVEIFGKLLLRAACGSHTYVCFLSRQEVDDFVVQTGVPRERVYFTPFFATLTGAEVRRALAVRAQDAPPYVFSGGNSSRDYQLLVSALQDSGHQVQVATRAQLRWPSNFRCEQLQHDQFVDAMAAAAVVVVALNTRTRRSVGQQTYLNAMLLGIPVVVNEAVGVRELLTDGIDAYIVAARDPAALRTAVDRVLHPANASEVQQVARRGQATARALGPESYFAGLRRLLCQIEERLVTPR